MKTKLEKHIIRMLSLTSEVIWCIDVNTFELLYTNNACFRIWGYTADEMIENKSHFYTSIHPDDIEVFKAGFTQAIQHGRTHLEFRILHRDNTVRHIKGDAIYMRGEEDFPDTLTGIAVDNTTEKILQEELVESELLFRSITNDSPIFIWTTDEHNITTFFNETWIRFSGCNDAVLLNKIRDVLIHPDDLQRVRKIQETHFSNHTPFEVECRLKDKSGVFRWFLLRYTPRFNRLNAFVGYIGTGIEITELKDFNQIIAQHNENLQLALDESKRLLHIVNKTVNIIILTDKAGRMTWVNEAFTEITGFTFEEAIGQKPGDLLQGPDTDPAAIRRMHESIQKGEPLQIEVLNYKKDKSKYWIEFRMEPIYKGDELEGFMAIEIDITQRKINEKIIDEKNKSIRDFSYVTSHELRHEFSKLMLLLDDYKSNEMLVSRTSNYQNEIQPLTKKINDIISRMNFRLSGEQASVTDTHKNLSLTSTVQEVILIDDDHLVNSLHSKLISKIYPEIQIRVFTDTDPALEYLKTEKATVAKLILLDLNFHGKMGWNFLDDYHRFELKYPVVILSSSIEHTDIKKSKDYRTVIDYLVKPLRKDHLTKIITELNTE